MEVGEAIRKAAKVLAAADAVLITAGAGIGVDSGLPDFRGDSGFWKAYPPLAGLGIRFVEMANPRWFQEDRHLAWGFYGHRLNLYRNTQPHPGFRLLLDIARHKADRYFVFTSNVDGQFQKAGFHPDRIEECHGSLHHLQCTVPCGDGIWDAGSVQIEVDEQSFRATSALPKCPACEALARPNVLMFGDWQWVPNRTEEQAARRTEWLTLVREKGWHLAVVETGAGKTVPTVRRFSESVARTLGGVLIRINPRDCEVYDQGDISLPLGSEEAIVRLSSKVLT